MTETKNSKMLDEGGKSVVALMAALMAAIFAFQLNASMLSPALTTMRVELNTTDAQIGLTQTVFFTSCAVFSLFLPRLGDLIGRKKVLLGILVLTALGCVVSALAVNVPMLMIGRVIQGVAGPIVPMTLIMLHAKVTEDKKYAKLMAILTSVNGGIGGVDAILGGWLAGTFGFRSVVLGHGWRCGACHCACVRVCGRIHRFRDSEDGLGWRGFPCRRILGRISGHQRDSEAGIRQLGDGRCRNRYCSRAVRGVLEC